MPGARLAVKLRPVMRPHKRRPSLLPEKGRPWWMPPDEQRHPTMSGGDVLRHRDRNSLFRVVSGCGVIRTLGNADGIEHDRQHDSNGNVHEERIERRVARYRQTAEVQRVRG